MKKREHEGEDAEKASKRRRRQEEVDPEAEAIWQGMLLGDFRIHQLGELSILDLSLYLQTHPAIAALTDQAYRMAFWRDMQAPMRGGLYGFAALILSEYKELTPREQYSLANVMLAWLSTQAAAFLSDAIDWHQFSKGIARKLQRGGFAWLRRPTAFNPLWETAASLERPRRYITSTAVIAPETPIEPFCHVHGRFRLMRIPTVLEEDDLPTMIRVAIPSPNHQYWHALGDIDVRAIEMEDGAYKIIEDDRMFKVRYGSLVPGHEKENVFEVQFQCPADEFHLQITAINVERFVHQTSVIVKLVEIAQTSAELDYNLVVHLLYAYQPPEYECVPL